MPGPTWQQMQIGFSSPSRNTQVDLDFDPLSEALREMSKNRKSEFAAGEVQKSLGIQDPDLFVEAMKQGAIKVTPENYSVLKDRVNELLTQQVSRQALESGKLGMEKTKQDMRATDLSMEGTQIANKQSQFDLDKSIKELNLAEERLALAPEVSKRFGALKSLAITNPDEAFKLVQDPTTREMLARAGIPEETITAFGNSLYQVAQNTRTEYTSKKDFANTEGNRAFTEERQDINARQAANQADRTEAASADTEKNRLITQADTDRKNAINAKTVAAFQEIIAGPSGGSLNSLYEAAANHPDPEVRALLPGKIAEVGAAYADKTPDQIRDLYYANNPTAATGPRTAGRGYTAPAGSLVGLVDQNEGGGDYSALYNGAQRQGGEYAGYDVSTKTIGELDRFANSGYGDYVAQNNDGTWSSPMGRYQIVNSTLQAAAKTLGLSPDTVFDKATQDQIFQFLVNQRLGSRGGLQGQMAGLRNEWVGLKNVDDATLAKAIQDFQGGSLAGLEGAIAGRPGVPAAPGADVVPLDETQGPAAVDFLQDLSTKKGPVTGQDLSILAAQAKNYDSATAILTDSLNQDDMFGGQVPAVLTAMEDPNINTKSIADVGLELKEKFGEIAGDQLISEINTMRDRYGVSAGVAQAFIENAPQETLWLNPLSPDLEINQGRIDELFGKLYDLDKPAGQRMRGALETLQTMRQKAAGRTNLEKLQARYAEAMTEAVNVAQRKLTNPNIDDKKPIRMLKMATEALDAELRRIDEDPATTVNITNAPSPADAGILDRINRFFGN